MISWFRKLAVVASVALVTACGGSDDPHPQNIVDTAKADPQFSILVEAVVAADLVTTLSGAGPYTVLAPTNTAFGALLTELGVTKAQLLADKPLLTSVLKYHVLSGAVPRASVPLGKAISTVQGGILKIDSVPAGLVVTDGRNRTAKITATDIGASNGVLHVIDKVLLPANRTIVETAIATPSLSILVEAVTAANLGATLSAAGPYTVFAPTNDAFAALLTELGLTKAQLLADLPLLTKVLTYHVIGSRVLKAEIQTGQPVPTREGETLSISAAFIITDQRARTASIVAPDVLASNGVVHLIDKVILPRP